MRTNIFFLQALLLGGVLLSKTVGAQTLDLERLSDIKKNKLVRFGGGISANSIFYSGNGGSFRDPFTYFVQGTLNAKVGGLVDVPISFNLTNVNSGFNLPTLPTRLSLHPKYKSVTGHLGDIAMSFSPYTLNGFLFRGAGVDVTPKGNLSFSAMGGRLQKATEYDSANQVVPAAYERFGYGARADFRQSRYRIGMIVFAAKDRVNSLKNFPDSLNILPQQNMVVSWTGSVVPAKDLELSAEYATSALTKNLRDTTQTTGEGKNVVTSLIDRRNSTAVYNAIKSNLNYKYKSSIIGVGYERIDPGYATLGAYFFNNDLENITLNLSQSLFKSKGQLAVNIGLQKDNLDGNKIGSNRRSVYAFNFNYFAGERLTAMASYSNFSTFMNIRPLFQTINQSVTPFTNLDTLNYTQVSQNANTQLNYLLQKTATRNQSLSFNFNYMNTADRQGGLPKFGAASQLLNATLSYTLLLVPQEANLTLAFNSATSRVAQTNFQTLGPTLALGKKLFKLVTTNLIASYNTSNSAGQREGSVWNTRLNLAYRMKTKQSLNLSFLNQIRQSKNTGNTHDFVMTAGYNYFF